MKRSDTVIGAFLLLLSGINPAFCQESVSPEAATELAPTVGLESQMVEQSPVLRRWLQSPPDLLREIRETPVRPTRVQVGWSRSQNWFVGIDDLYLSSRFSVGGDYDQWDEARQRQYSTVLRYYISPVGSRFNVAPQVGYRWLQTGDQHLSGWEVGASALVVLAPQSADISVDYRLLTGASQATTLSVTTAYALSPDFRVGARYRWQNTTRAKDLQVGLVLEWTP